MNTSLNIVNAAPGVLHCTLDLPFSDGQRITLHLQIQKQAVSPSLHQLEEGLLVAAHQMLGELIEQHRTSGTPPMAA